MKICKLDEDNGKNMGKQRWEGGGLKGINGG